MQGVTLSEAVVQAQLVKTPGFGMTLTCEVKFAETEPIPSDDYAGTAASYSS